MKFLIERASERLQLDSEKLPIEKSFVVRHCNEDTCEPALFGIEIDSLEELVGLCEKSGHGFVIEKNDWEIEFQKEYKYKIIIYDDFLE